MESIDFDNIINCAAINAKTKSRKKKDSTKKVLFSSALPPPKKQTKETKGVNSAGVKAFLERKEQEERKELEVKQQQKSNLQKLRLEQNTMKTAKAMASRTKDNLKTLKDQDVNEELTAGLAKKKRVAYEVTKDHLDLLKLRSQNNVQEVLKQKQIERQEAYNKLFEKNRPDNGPDTNKINDEPMLSVPKPCDRVSEEKERAHSKHHKKHKKHSRLKDEGEEHRKKTKTKEEKKADNDTGKKKAVPVIKRRNQLGRPPPISFNQILNIAQKKQFVPIKIEQSLENNQPKSQEQIDEERAKLGKKRVEGYSASTSTHSKSLSGDSNNSTVRKEVTKKGFSSVKMGPPDCSLKPSGEGNLEKNRGSKHTSKKSVLSPKLVAQKRKVEEEEAEVQRQIDELKRKQKELQEQRKKEHGTNVLKTLKNEQRGNGHSSRDYGDDSGEDGGSDDGCSEDGYGDDYDDDYDDDDSMDDFIDDGKQEDYSSHIREIFGYDKRKYRDDEDDASDMEANYSQIMKEEARSAKIGKMEDREDMRMEEEAARQKLLKKKKLAKLKR